MTVTSTIGTASRNYSTMALWAASLPSTLSQPYRGELYNDSEFVDDICLISHITTSTTNTITVTAAAGQSFADNASVQTNALTYNQANGVACRNTHNYNTFCAIHVDTTSNVTISRLQLKKVAGTYRNVIRGEGVCDYLVFEKNLCMGADGQAAVISLFGAGIQNIIRNNVVIATGGGVGIMVQNSNTPGNDTIASNTVVVPTGLTNTGYGIQVNYNSVTIKNNLVFGFGAGPFTDLGNGATVTSTTNQTDKASPPSGWTAVTYANQFQSNTNAAPDFRLKSGAPAIDAGTTDTTNSATDIVGTARPQGSAYDIGAWEYVSSGSTLNFTARAAGRSRGAGAFTAGAAVTLRAAGRSRGRAPILATAAATGRTAARSGLRAPMAATATLTARAGSQSRGSAVVAALVLVLFTARSGAVSMARAAMAATAAATGRAGASSAGRAGLLASAAILAHASAASAGRAATSIASLLSFTARAGASSRGAAPLLGTASLTGRAGSASSARAGIAATAAAMARAGAATAARAAMSTGTLLAFVARAGGLSAGRASSSATASLTGRAGSSTRAAAPVSAIAAFAGRIGAASRASAAATSGVLLYLTGRAGGRSGGRAPMAATATFTGRATAGGRGRASVTARAVFTALARGFSAGRLRIAQFVPPYSQPVRTAFTASEVSTAWTRSEVTTQPEARYMQSVNNRPPPETFGALRVGDVRARSRDYTAAFGASGDTVASVVSIVYTRQDGQPNDLVLEASGSVDPGGLRVRWGISGGTAGVTYLCRVTVVTTNGETLIRDGLQYVSATLG